MEFNLEKLEYDKVLNKIIKYSHTKKGIENILNIKPIYGLDKINLMYKEVKEAIISIVKYSDIPISINSDVNNIVLRASLNGILSSNELHDISLLIGTISNVIKYKSFLYSMKIDITSLEKYFNKLYVNNKLKNEIDYAIDSNSNVVDNASSNLLMIRRNISSLNNKLRNKLNEIILSSSNMLTESLIATRSNRLCLPYKVEYKNNIKGIILDESSSGTTVYIEPYECSLINEEISKYKEKEKTEIEAILKSLSLLVNASKDELLDSIESLYDLDIIYSKALFSIDNDYNIPSLNNNGITKLIKASHPLIDKNIVVPIDIHFGDKFNTIIITGPNTGGKTVALKTVGLISLMAQSGIPVPVKEESNISIFENIFVDIGDEQSIEQNLSTFSSHMKKICNILDNISSNSLVLLDELGSGTDPKEGASLAVSIIEYLIEKNAKTICTTHYSALKEFAYSNNNICNASVEFNSETLMPTYKLLMGIPGKSNAISIALKLGLNKNIIDKALKLIENKNTDSEALIEKLDIENSKISNIKAMYENKINEYNLLLDSLKKEKDDITNKKDQIIKEAISEAKDIINKAKDDSNKLLEDIKKLKDNYDFKEHELADIKFKARNLNIDVKKEEVFESNIKINDHVFIKSYNKNGIVTGIKKDKYLVSVGQFSIAFDKHDLKVIEAPKKIKTNVKKTYGSIPSKNAKLELDLRGFRYEEVKEELDRFIDKAYLSNMSMVHIIHGYGTGAVREAVYAYIKKCPYVKSYRYGGEGEGLNGVTVVYLK